MILCQLSVIAPTGIALADEQAGPPKIYVQLVDPREHPDYERRAVRPPDWDTFENRTHLTSVRGFPTREELDRCAKNELGDVVWPVYTLLQADNLEAMVDEIKQRGIFLFDLWGYVPGTGGPNYPSKAPPKALQLLESKLGPRWLGVDVGEQDGRYVGGYAPKMCPASASRQEQYFNFHRFFQRMTDDWGNKMSSLVSLNFGHYLVKEGVYTLLGAETAQGLPNSQLYYAFIRGACKQYGLLWFGNASIFNRWGYKDYAGSGGGAPGYKWGPTDGTSLSLLKRLMYNHILYNSAIIGFENGWLVGEELSPIGKIQQAAGRWIKTNGQPGTMATPVAVMTDFFAGWSFPRHLYTGLVYRVWGNLPYAPGDYLTDGVLDRLYPGYEKASYYHDESGFLTPTPFGDSADCLLSDAPAWLLKRYALLVVTGDLAGGAEIRDKLTEYVEGGGHLVITAGNVAKMPGGLAGIRVAGSGVQIAAAQQVAMTPTPVTEDLAFTLLPLELPGNARIVARCGQTPAAAEIPVGSGQITVLATPFGVGNEPTTQGGVASPMDGPLAKPFPLLKHVATLLDEAFRRQTLFEAGEGLQTVVCRKGQGVYTVGILNNAYRPLPFSLVSHCGSIESVRELTVDTSERGAVGQLPPGIELAAIGENGPQTIAGGDVRIFEVRLAKEEIAEIPHVVPPTRPRNRFLPLRKPCSLMEEILARPTFFQHFDGILVDWRYFHERRMEVFQQEAAWIARQKLRVIVDLSTGLNLYPDLRHIDNSPEELAATMAVVDDLLAKMAVMGAQDLVVALHSAPELGMTQEQYVASTDAAMREICRRAKERGVTVHLRVCPGKPPGNLVDTLWVLERLGIENLRLAVSTGLLAVGGPVSSEVAAKASGKIGLWMAGNPAMDINTCLYDVHRPIADDARREQLLQILALAPDAPIVFDVLYDNQDAEYLDARFVERLSIPAAKQP